ncbi:MAG: hypothetical protein FLDDKLPJ_00552 [Phycisphaerae bacterium]|nr:hypothetical protein [Phycisphaerae bacterium]
MQFKLSPWPRSVLLFLISGVAVGVAFNSGALLRWTHALTTRLRGGKSVADRLDEFGADARARLVASFGSAGVVYPPERVVLWGIKEDRKLRLYAASEAGASWRRVAEHPILGASGELGPKLREGDGQVPEGVYLIESLNPNSRFHVSLRLNYPNEFDRRMGVADGRERLGSDIMIHGGTASVGCLAMGDAVAEELFVLAHDVGIENMQVLVTPVDLRHAAGFRLADGPAWAPALYRELAEKASELP